MVELRLNGEDRQVDGDAGRPAIYALRNELGQKSVRLGCGLEQCGACAVLVDGEARLTCRMAVGDLAGRVVETVEGLDSPVQRVLAEANATQCGFCLSGIVIAAEALFRRKLRPTRAEIVAALDPHLCRCGSHPRVLRSLLALAGRIEE